MDLSLSPLLWLSPPLLLLIPCHPRNQPIPICLAHVCPPFLMTLGSLPPWLWPNLLHLTYLSLPSPAYSQGASCPPNQLTPISSLPSPPKNCHLMQTHTKSSVSKPHQLLSLTTYCMESEPTSFSQASIDKIGNWRWLKNLMHLFNLKLGTLFLIMMAWIC